MKTILGIDPGAFTGIATYHDGKLAELNTIRPVYIFQWLGDIKPARVIYEDSRLTSPVWDRKTTLAARMKIARNVGQVDGVCALIDASCEILQIPAHGISPKGKGAKVKEQDVFNSITGWVGLSNQHTRDGAMVAYPYRGAK